MSQYAEGTARDDNIRWLWLGLAGLIALVAAGLMALDTGALAFSIIVFLGLSGGLTLGAASIALVRAGRTAMRVPR